MKTQQTTISEVSLIYRSKVKASERPQVRCSRDAYNLFKENWDLDTLEHVEEFTSTLKSQEPLKTNSAITIPIIPRKGDFGDG
jgi:hypothetical protein